MSAAEPLPERPSPGPAIRRIASLLQGLVRRERALLLGAVLLQGLWSVWAALAIVELAPMTGATRPGAVAALVLVLGIGAFAAMVWPLLRGWRRAGDRVRQARLVEGLVPVLRGRLVSSAERLAGPVGQESAALLDFTAGRAAGLVGGVTAGHVHPAVGLVARAALTALLFGMLPLLLLLSPLGARGTWDWWTAGQATSVLATGSSASAAPTARVGDLVLRYVYPAYTGLDPKEIPNSTGEAHAPPGTRVEVRARSADVLESAAIAAYDQPPEAATLDDGGRSIAGGFAIGTEPGKWRIIALRGGVSTPSRDFDIVPEPDLPPDVMLDAADRVDVGYNERIPVRWHARDDFGIRRVIFEANGKEVGGVLSAPRERQAEVSGEHAPTPQDLGLHAGDRVRLSVAAWDNDAVSGSKKGVSRTIELIVGGGEVDMGLVRREALIAILVDMLAGHLEERWPPGRGNAEFKKWGSVLAERYQPLDSFVERDLGGTLPRGLEGDAIRHVRRAGGQLIRYVHTTFQDADVVPADTDVATAGTLRDQAAVTLENEILVLDWMQRRDSLMKLLEAAQRLGRSAEDTKAALAAGDLDAFDIGNRTVRLDRALDTLQKAAKTRNDKGITDLVESRSTEMRALSAEIEAAVQRDDTREANVLMRRLAGQMGDLADAIEDVMTSGKQSADEALAEAQKLLDELESIEKEQSKLRDEVRAAREKSDRASAEKLEQLWRKAEENAAQNRLGAQLAEEGMPDGTAMRQFAQDGTDKAGELEDAVRNRDLHRARAALDESRFASELMERLGDRKASQGTQRRLDQLERQLQQIEELSQRESAQGMAGMQDRQDELSKRLQAARKKAGEVSQDLPIQPSGMDEGLKEAEEGMQQASEDIQSGQPMQAEGSQSSARQGVQDAAKALEEAMKQAAAGGGSGEGDEGQQGGEKKEKGKGGSDQNDGRDDEEGETFIPLPDAFRTPEEYRRELLDGMEGEVPEQYRALKKRYYEELVHQ